MAMMAPAWSRNFADSGRAASKRIEWRRKSSREKGLDHLWEEGEEGLSENLELKIFLWKLKGIEIDTQLLSM